VAEFGRTSYGALTVVPGIDPKYYYLTLGLLASGFCVLVGLIVAYSFQREVKEDLAPPTEKDVFDPIEKAYYSGLMNEDEFKRIRESMARQKGETSSPGSKARKPRPKPIQAEPPTPLVENEPDTETDEE
jgi:hypothetical protein